MKNACSSAVRALRRSGHLTWRQNRFAGGFGGTITPSTFSTLKNKGNSPWHPEKYSSPRAAAPPPSSTSPWWGVALEARRFGSIERIYGARHGVRGIVNEDFVDLTQETHHNLELVAGTPSSALGSTRDKPDLAYCQEIFKVLQAHEIEHFFYIGGNDSSDTVRIVSLEAQKAGYPLRCIHIPKTIDNDLVGNDHTPGFPSAARFVAQAFAGANLDNAALPGVYVGVVMGRAMRAF
jgi:hypothetical protein